MAGPTFAHAVNLFSARPGSGHGLAQEITLQTMRLAREFSGQAVGLELYAAVFPEDTGLVPPFFDGVLPLSRSILDFQTHGSGRKLPLIGEILDKLFQVSRADYFIYTNADIAVQPYFYLALTGLASAGADSFIITRRTIDAAFNRPDQVPLMVAQVGAAHPGSDCFVFRRGLVEKFRLGHAVIGGEFIGLALRVNLAAFSRGFTIFRDKHLTFHIGDDREWLRFTADSRHNQAEVEAIFKNLLSKWRLPGKKKVKELYRDFGQRLERLHVREQAQGGGQA